MQADLSQIADAAFLMGQLLAAAASFFCAIWLFRTGDRARRDRMLSVAALISVGIWCIAIVGSGYNSIFTELASLCRNLLWIALIFVLFRSLMGDTLFRQVKWLNLVLLAAEAVQLPLVVASIALSDNGEARLLIGDASVLLRMLVSVGALILTHNLFVEANQRRSVLRWAAVAMASFWGIELGAYVGLFALDPSEGGLWSAIYYVRSVGPIFFAVPLCVAAKAANAQIRLAPSRSVTFRSLSVLLIAAYAVAVGTLARSFGEVSTGIEQWIVSLLLVAALVTGFLWLPSKQFREGARELAARHLFKHRYDFRRSWLRFSETIGQRTGRAENIEARCLRTMCDLLETSGGHLFTVDDVDGFQHAASYPLSKPDLHISRLPTPIAHKLTLNRQIVAIDGGLEEEKAELHEWLGDVAEWWALVPMFHFDKLVGVALLQAPSFRRKLDWEDIELMQVLGSQIGSYLAEHSAQKSLMDAEKFDEFNKRMAFLMHDIKNLSSQLSLLVRNAETHLDNPEFRADMLTTLENSSRKMRGLVAKLGNYDDMGEEASRTINLEDALRALIRKLGTQDSIRLGMTEPCYVEVFPDKLVQALSHLMQNALDATENATPVVVDCKMVDGQVRVTIADSGCGMSPEFVRNDLFRPFVSTKTNGFGIGAYEARKLIRECGGEIAIVSEKGIGTIATVILPAADANKITKVA